MATGGEILAELLCMIDNNSRPSLLFGAPALSVSQVETNLSLQPGGLDPARLKGIIEPLADSLFDRPRKVVVRELHRSGDVEFWLAFEEVTENARPSSVAKLAKLPPPAPQPSNTPIQTKSGLDDRLKAAALKDTPEQKAELNKHLSTSDSTVATTSNGWERHNTATQVDGVKNKQTAVPEVGEDIILQDEEQKNATQGAVSETEQAFALQLDSRHSQLESPASVEEKGSSNPPERMDTMHLEDTSDPIHITAEYINDQDLVAATISTEVTQPFGVLDAKSNNAENVATNHSNYSPIDAFEFDMVDLLSPADSPAPLGPGTPDVHAVKCEENLAPRGSQLGGSSPPLTPPFAEEWQSRSMAAPAERARTPDLEPSSQIQTPASEESVQLDALRPTGLVVDLDLSHSGAESDDQFELDLGGTPSSSESRDEQGDGRPQSPFNSDEVFEDYHSRSATANGSIYASSSPGVSMEDVDRVMERSDEPPASFIEECNMSPTIQNRPPHLAHYISPLPSPTFHVEEVHPSPSSLGPAPRQPVGDEAASSSLMNTSVSSGYQRREEPGLVCMDAQAPKQETEEDEEDLLEHIPMTASSASDPEANFSLDDLSPSSIPNVDHFPSTPISPLSPVALFTTSDRDPVSFAVASEENGGTTSGSTQASLPPPPARTDAGGSVDEPHNEPERLGVCHIDSPSQIHHDSNRVKPQAPLPSPPVGPLRTGSETPPITPFIDKVFRDLPFAPHLPPALRPESLRQHGHWLAYELVAVLVVFVLLLPA